LEFKVSFKGDLLFYGGVFILFSVFKRHFSVVKDSMTTSKDGKSCKTKYYSLGKKWFAFSKMEKHSVQNILNSILQLL
jgi:hypothetical protein